MADHQNRSRAHIRLSGEDVKVLGQHAPALVQVEAAAPHATAVDGRLLLLPLLLMHLLQVQARTLGAPYHDSEMNRSVTEL